MAALPNMGSSEQEQRSVGGNTTCWSLGLCDRAPHTLTPMGLMKRLPLNTSDLIALVCKYISFSVWEIQSLIYDSENSSGIKKKHHCICPERHRGISQCLERD